MSTVLLVEYRDEVFARLAGDFAAMGMWVERACSSVDAFCRFARCSSALVIANANMPGEGGWLLAGKLRLAWPMARVWLYAPRPSWSSEYDHGLAHFLGVAELIYYQGNLWWLAEEIRSRFIRPPRDVRLAARGVA
ncbi:MAG: response regulator [Pirellulales bacterium]